MAPILLTALAASLAMWSLTAARGAPAGEAVASTSLEMRRRQQVAAGSLTYACCGRLVRRLAEAAPISDNIYRSIELRLNRARHALPWTAGEWAVATLLEAAATAGCLGLVYPLMARRVSPAVVVALLALVAYTIVSWRSLSRHAARRVSAIRARLPFMVDSVALAMEAGIGPLDALTLATESCTEAALGEELSEVVADVRHGQPLADSLTALRRRLQVREIDEFATALATSHQLGARVCEVLWDMSRRLRDRREQEIEVAVGRAQVQLYYPGTLLLVVCMVAVAAPFVAPMWTFLSGAPN